MYSLQTYAVAVGAPLRNQNLYGPFASETEAKAWAKPFERGGIPYTVQVMLGNPHDCEPWLKVSDKRVL